MAERLSIGTATPRTVADLLEAPPQVAGCLGLDWNEACEQSAGGFGTVRMPDDWYFLPAGTACRVADVRIGGVVESLCLLNPESRDAHFLGGTTHHHLLDPPRRRRSQRMSDSCRQPSGGAMSEDESEAAQGRPEGGG
jgi:hypothetical protein